MAKVFCDFRLLLLVAAVVFIYIQMRLFATQSEYADRLAAAIEAENHCTSQMQSLIGKISSQQGRIVALEEERKRLDQECGQMRSLVQDLERKDLRRLIDKVQVPVAAVVIMACNRADYLERTINSVLKYQRPISSRYPVFVSQDGSNSDVKSKALSYDELSYMQLVYLLASVSSVLSPLRMAAELLSNFVLKEFRQHNYQHLDFEAVKTERPGELIAYYKIASHYKWALDQLFYKHNFSRVIILEDDMEIAPDFFDYFEAMATLIDKDKSIMAVSSWNDNGQKQFVHDPYELYRSDFFPGLGWMLARSTWDELSPKWPKAYWDDWLRLKENHKGRQFIRPEVCRTYNFGEHGSSLGQFFSQYLEPIKLNEVQVDWKSMDLSYLLEDKYATHFANSIEKAKPVSGSDIIQKAQNIDGDIRIKYKDQWDFENIAQKFGIFQEWKDGVPRTAYKGVVVFRYQTTRRIFLVGPESLKLLQIEDS